MERSLARDGQNGFEVLNFGMGGYDSTTELIQLALEVIPYARFSGADGQKAYFQHSTSGEAIVCENMDTLVIAQGHQPNTSLEHELADSGIELHLAGDCLSPRSAEEAIYEGMMVSRQL